MPLYVTAWIGVVIIAVSGVLGVQTLYNYVAGNAVSGFTTVILLMIFFSGVILASIGVVAVYMAKVIEEVKRRPIFIIRKEDTRSNTIEDHRVLPSAAMDEDRGDI